MSKLIGIDAGHSYVTAGKRTPDGSMREYEFNSTTATYLKEELEYNGFRVVMTPTTKYVDLPLSARVSFINLKKCDMSISIHANAFQGTSWGTANGIETFAYSKTSKGNDIAKLVQSELIKATGLRDRGVKYDSLYMTRKPNCPAILCECGFMDNIKEANLLKSDSYRRLCAKAMCKGICRYYGVTYKEKGNSKPIEKPIVPSTENKFKNGDYNKTYEVKSPDGKLTVRTTRPTDGKLGIKLGELNNGDKVFVGYVLNDWGGIKFNEKQGFVNMEYLVEVNEPKYDNCILYEGEVDKIPAEIIGWAKKNCIIKTVDEHIVGEAMNLFVVGGGASTKFKELNTGENYTEINGVDRYDTVRKALELIGK